MNLFLLSLMSVLFLLATAPTQAAEPGESPQPRFHLTARPWKPLNIPGDAYLDRIEGIVRFSAKHQDASGAIIDPFLKKEHQYATPYYAHAVGVLLKAGRARDLQESGIRAMDWASGCFEKNTTDGHSVFYLPVMIESLDLYKPLVSAATFKTWRERMTTAIVPPERRDNNWATYQMLGEWLRFKAGLAERKAAVDLIEDKWVSRQRGRIVDTPFSLYHDTSSSPDTLAVEAVGRVNLLALIHAGYDGSSAGEIRHAAEAGSRTSLLLQDPSGQMPCNGRTDDHVWADVGYQLAFELMARRAWDSGQKEVAGQYRHAALLAFGNLDRWRRADGEWAGSYYVTKNHFDPALRIGYQAASQYSNYNGSLMHHLAEAYELGNGGIPELPAPVEIGGYALALDGGFATAVANAGGMQLQFDLQGDRALSSGNADYWNALGVVRIGRPNWDTRLGPADGARDGASGLGVSFAPTFQENGQWTRLASVPDRYEGKFSSQFVHPLLVRCAVDYAPRSGATGPSFRHEFTITPDGVLAVLTRTAGSEPWGITLPLLADDGRPLRHGAENRIAWSCYTENGDRQNFIALNPDARFTQEPAVRSTFGDLVPMRVVTDQRTLRIFIYPASSNDPTAQSVRDSFAITPQGFTSVLGTVAGQLYIGRTSAGGVSNALTVPGSPTIRFDPACGFVLQCDKSELTAIETDRETRATIDGKVHRLSAYVPLRFGGDRTSSMTALTIARWRGLLVELS